MFSTAIVRPHKLSFLQLLIKRICRIIDFDTSLQNKFRSWCLSVFLFLTQLSVVIYATDRESHYAVLGKTNAFTISAATVHFRAPSLSNNIFITNSNKIFSKHQHVKSLRQKQKMTASQKPPMDGTFLDISYRESKLHVHFCFKLTFQFSFLRFAFSYFQFHGNFFLSYAYIWNLCTCKTIQRPFEGFLLNSHDNVQTLHHVLLEI